VLLDGLLAGPGTALALTGAAGAPPASAQPINTAASGRCGGRRGRRAGMRAIL